MSGADVLDAGWIVLAVLIVALWLYVGWHLMFPGPRRLNRATLCAIEASLPLRGNELAKPWICPKCGRGVAPDQKSCDHGGTAAAAIRPLAPVQRGGAAAELPQRRVARKAASPARELDRIFA